MSKKTYPPSFLHALEELAGVRDTQEHANETEVLKRIIEDTLWMAQRYADGRSTYAVGMFNNAVHALDGIGLGGLFKADKRFADDGMYGRYNPETRRHEGQ